MDNKIVLSTNENYVVKANKLIQKSRFNLSLQQQKIILYLISKIDINDEEFKLYQFSIQEFCKTCEIDYKNGANYIYLKKTIQDICDKSIWVKQANGKETLLRWIERPFIDENNGTIEIKLDELMKPYLLQLKENFTRYQLIYILYFKSKYSIRLYELLKSVHYKEIEEYKKIYSVEELKKMLDAEVYKNYFNLKQKVVEPAIKEINEYSDKIVSYHPIKTGRKVTELEFTISTKSTLEIIKMRNRIDDNYNNKF